MALRLYVIICIACMMKCDACPTNCSCDSTDLSVNCEHRNLLKIPEGIPNQTLKLNLMETNITEIPTGSFATMENLTHLYLSLNLIRSINNYTFAGLIKLQTLYLDYNKPLDIAVDTFRELKELRHLRLIAVRLEDFTGLFVDLNNLVILYVQKNVIAYVEDRVFEDLRNLIYLRIEVNAIKKIDPKVLHDLRGLQTIKFKENPLTCDCDAVKVKDFLLSRQEESGVECAEFGGEDLLDVEDFSMCAKRGVFCSAENVQIIIGELIALITNAQTPVKCGINCGNEQQCNGFVLREDALCELWRISHKNIAYNISTGHRMFVLC